MTEQILISKFNLLTVEEVAKILKVSVPTVRRIIESREVAFYKIRGAIRFNEADILAYLEKQLIKPIEEQFYRQRNKSH